MPDDTLDAGKEAASKLIPPRPSGYRGQCRSVFARGAEVVGFGRTAVVPPVAGAVSAGWGVAGAFGKNIAEGNVGGAFTAVASGIPAIAAGFFGGGAAADAVQGLTNEALSRAGADADKLPDSSLRNMVQDATCVKPPPPPGPPIRLTDSLPKGDGKPMVITPAQQKKLDNMKMPGLY